MPSSVKRFDLGDGRAIKVVKLQETDRPSLGRRGTYKINVLDPNTLTSEEYDRNIQSKQEAVSRARDLKRAMEENMERENRARAIDRAQTAQDTTMVFDEWVENMGRTDFTGVDTEDSVFPWL